MLCSLRQRPGREERFEELYRGSDDHRRVPVLGRQGCLDRRIGVVQVGVVLHDLVRAYGRTEHVRVLLDDARVGDDVDYPVLPVFGRVLQREGHAGEGLAASRRDREREEPRGQGSRRAAVGQHGPPGPVHHGGGDGPGVSGQPFHVRVKTRQEFRDGKVPPPECRFATVHVRFGIQEVRVHETGEEHPYP